MGIEVNISLGASILAGLFSFFSPCVLPLLPVYAAQLSTGISGTGRGRYAGISFTINALLFVAGFTLVFVVLGAATATAGKFLLMNRGLLLKAGGVFVVLMGLNLIGLLPMPALARHWLPLQGLQPRGRAGSFFIGAVFALGWTPCIGPVLASILTLAAASGSSAGGAVLLAGYSLGMAVPFLVLSIILDRVPRLQGVLSRYTRVIIKVSGLLLVILGALLFLDKLRLLSAYLYF